MAQNRFLEKRWQSTHLGKIKERAGNRYTPKLNVTLPIGEIFDGISRTENFYTSIREHYGKLNRELRRVPSRYENKELQKTYNALNHKISRLTILLGNLKEYNTEEIPWSKINRLSKKANTIVGEFSEKIRDERKQEGSPSETLNYRLPETRKELRHFEYLSSSAKAKLSNHPFLLLSGVAGTGKTHLLCDVVENRLSKSEALPAVVVFGEMFAATEDPFKQIIRQLDLPHNKQRFFRELNNAGEKSACRALIVIDALNETTQESFWKRNLSKVIDEVKKYSNVALVISVRSGFENEVLTEKQKNFFVHEEHRGFQFREWEAVDKFFREFQLPLPEIPLLMLEFQNPLFLLLFCKAFQSRTRKNKGKKQKQIFRGHEGATYIFEAFVDSVSKRLSNEFKIRNNVWDTVIEKVAEEMVKQGNDRLAEETVIEIVTGAYPSINYSHFIKELDRNLLLVKVPRYSIERREDEGFNFRFSFQKFSDHLIGRYVFKKYEKEFDKTNKNLETAKRFFSKRRKLGKFLANTWKNRGIVEALSVQCPEHLKGYELIEVAPYIKDSNVAQEAFVESLIWRKPSAFSADKKNTLAYINSTIIRTESDNLLNAFLAVAPIPNHPFNADFLHQCLSKFSMAKRDSWWSIFLHSQYGAKDSVDRLIEWGWSDQDKTHINDNAIRLCSVALCWFLTTSNRFLRDKATKALVALLTGRLSIVLDLLKQFKGVNDPYLAERLYAVAYGCALRSENTDGLKVLSEWVYNEIFKQGNPPTHILWRDYARGIIEVALKQNLSLRIHKKKITAPHNSKWPSRFPSNETIKKYTFDYESKDFKDYHWAQNSIISSMQPEHSEMFTMYGDFGRYIFQSALSHFSYPNNVTMQKLSNWAIKRIFNLGYDVKLHGQFDRHVNYNPASSSTPKRERIGKKYQWIALHELLARVSDNFGFKEESGSSKVEKYEGPWQLLIRDIDPSCILKDFPNEKPEDVPGFSKNEIQIQYNVSSKEVSLSAWLKKSRDLPDPKKVIEFIDGQGSAWVSLEGSFQWEEETPPEHKKYSLPTRMLWYMAKSYLVRNRDKDKVFKWAKQQSFMGRWMPESHEFYNVYLGEYPWAPAFLYRYIRCHHDGWTDETEYKKIPTKILVTDDEYLSSGSSRDCSTNEAFCVKLLAKFIVDEMNLNQSYFDGRFFDNKRDLVAFDPTVFNGDMPSYMFFIRKHKLCDFLKQKDYSIFWILLGEKIMMGAEGIEQLQGRLEIDGVYTLNGKNKIIGAKRSRFKN